MAAKDFTERMIIEAFQSLLEKKPFNKITVKDVITEAGVSRNTFYYHFQDVYDLAVKYFEKQIIPYEDIELNPENIEEVLMQVTQLAKESQKTLYHLINAIDRTLVERYLYRVCHEGLKKHILHTMDGKKYDPESLEFFLEAYTCAIVGLIIKWLSDGMQTDAKPLIKKYSEFFVIESKYILEKISTN